MTQVGRGAGPSLRCRPVSVHRTTIRRPGGYDRPAWDTVPFRPPAPGEVGAPVEAVGVTYDVARAHRMLESSRTVGKRVRVTEGNGAFPGSVPLASSCRRIRRWNPVVVAAPQVPKDVTVWAMTDAVPFWVGSALDGAIGTEIERAFGRPPVILAGPDAVEAAPEGAVFLVGDDWVGRRFLEQGGAERRGAAVVRLSARPPRANPAAVWVRPQEASAGALAVAARAARMVARMQEELRRVLADLAWQRQALEDLRSVDPETELLTREAFFEETQRSIDPTVAGTGSGALGVVRFRIARLSRLRSDLGDAGLAQVLADVAQRLRGTVRQQDRVGRIAEDEFAVLVRGEGVEREVSRLVRVMGKYPEEPVILPEGEELWIGARIGWALHHEIGAPGDASSFVRAADPRWPLRLGGSAAASQPLGTAQAQDRYEGAPRSEAA